MPDETLFAFRPDSMISVLRRLDVADRMAEFIRSGVGRPVDREKRETEALELLAEWEEAVKIKKGSE